MSRRLPALLLALAVTNLAFSEEVDPPGRVARISVIQGNVSFQAEDAKTPEDAELNFPVTSGDRLITESDARTELSLGIAAIRVDERTDLSVSNLDEDIAQFELNSGAVSVHLRELASGDTFEIDTPNAMVRLMKPGDYRVDVLADGTSVLAVRNGDAQIDSGNGVVNVHDQQEARLAPQDRFADVVVLGTPDEFDDWSMDRERQLAEVESTRYVSREVVGYEDLDRYGEWYSEPEYGEVWVPRYVGLGWAPYTYGRWVWVGSWGWTWVDYAPWGFAPFHYGRWAHVRDRWCWVPGPRHRRPIYAPALVGWGGPHRIKGFYSRDRRPDRWVPLGPREVYVPAHRASSRYLRNVNIGNTIIDDNTRITHAWRNRDRDRDFLNRNAPGVGVRPPNNGMPINGLNGGVNGDGQWRSGTGAVGPGWRTGPGRAITVPDRDHDNTDRPNNRWPRDVNGPGNGWSTRDPNDRDDSNNRWRDRNPGDGDRSNDRWNRNPTDGRWTNRDPNDRRDNRWNRGDDNRRSFDRGSGSNDQARPIVGDGRMTNPRNPSNDRRWESQRERMDREVAIATRRYEQQRNTDRTWQNRTDRQPNRDYGSMNRDRRDNSRSWNNGSTYRVPSQPDRPRSYGNPSGGNSTYRAPSPQPRSMPAPRVEHRSSAPPANRAPSTYRGGGNNPRANRQ